MTRRFDKILWISLAVVGSTTAAISQFLPWTRIGAASRTSFSLLRSADRLGFIDGQIATILYTLWFIIPVAAALAICAVALEWTKTAIALAVVTVGVVGSTALFLTVSRLPSLVGPQIGLAALAITVVSWVALAISTIVRHRS